MNQLTKAQLTIGLLAYFATMWDLVINGNYPDLFYAAGIIVLHLVLLLVLSYVLLALLEWIKIFDLKTNAILTFLVLITVRILSALM
jgi:hypothetical protein